MKTLVVWGSSAVAPARRRVEAGVRLVAWDETAHAALSAQGLEIPLVRERLGESGVDGVEAAACAWTRNWGRRPLDDGRSLRDLLTWNGLRLWYWVELFLFHSTGACQYVRLVETFRRLLAAEAPDEVEAQGLGETEALLLARTCTALGILFHDPPSAPRGRLRWRERGVSLAARWDAVKTAATAVKAAFAGPPPRPSEDGRRLVLLLTHAAFWKSRPDPETGVPQPYEHYFDGLIPEMEKDAELRPWPVAVGPVVAHRARRPGHRLAEWLRLPGAARPYVHLNRYAGAASWQARREAGREARALWRRLRGTPAIHEAFSHQGVAFDDLAAPDLAGMLLLQAPWAARSYTEAEAALAHLRPAAVCLYAEDSGWGRALEAAARRRGVPSVGIQHGILYPHYYSYMHAEDEDDCPRPDVTAVFGEAARRFLIDEGRYAPGSLVVTGSPKFDALLHTAGRLDRDALRAELGVGPDERLVVAASRYRGLRVSFQSIGTALPGLVRAVETLDGVRLLLKPHPAEPTAPYAAVVRALGATRTRVLDARSDLIGLLRAADALVTVESLSAVEALVLDRPVLVLNMPTNLRELVERGVALGVPSGVDPAPALRQLLFDPATADRLEAARHGYLPELAHGLDGGATRRILDLVRQTARAGCVVG